MKVLIVEDEYLASERLVDLVKQYDYEIEIIDSLDTIKSTVNFFEEDREVDLVFMDIQLSDGKSFEIFEKAKLETPVIFTTAYDDFMLKAFKTNSIDYLLKPINYKELKLAIDKYKKYWSFKNESKNALDIDYNKIVTLFNAQENKFKQRFLVKLGDKLKFVHTEDIGCFYADGKTVYLLEKASGRKFIVDYSLEEIEIEYLNPKMFFRINRKFIINLAAIKDIRSYVNSRLKIILNTSCDHDLIVSREKVTDFKNWLDN